MAEEKKDLNKSQLVADPDLNKDSLVAGPDLNVPGQDAEPGKLADGTDEDKTVKYSELKKIIDERNAAQEQTKAMQDQIMIMAANQQSNQQVNQSAQPKDVYEELGLGPEDYPTVDQQRQIDIYRQQQQVKQTQGLTNQQFESSHPDFSAVVGLRNPITGKIQPTAEILKILTEKSYLTAAAYSSSQGAYEIVMQQRELDKLQQQNIVQEEHLKQQGIDTKLAPVSGAAAAGGAVSASPAAVTIEEQRAMEQRVENGEFNQKG